MIDVKPFQDAKMEHVEIIPTPVCVMMAGEVTCVMNLFASKYLQGPAPWSMVQ